MNFACFLWSRPLRRAIALLLVTGHYSSCLAKEPDMQAIAVKVGVVTMSISGQAPPVYVLEEEHASPLGQMQEALMLTRLVRLAGVRDIALEGFMKNDEASTVSYIQKRHAEMNNGALFGMLDSLADKNINASEFVSATLGTSLHAIEIESQYVMPTGDASGPLSMTLYKVAVKHLIVSGLTDDQKLALAQKKAAAQAATNRETQAKLYRWFFKYVFQIDPWANAHQLSSPSCDFMATEEEIRRIREILTEATKLGVGPNAEDQAAIDSYMAFLKARSAASDTMVAAALNISGDTKMPIALIIGAAHTSKVVDLLKAANRHFVVFRNLALQQCDKAKDVSLSSYEAITNKQRLSDSLDPLMAPVFGAHMNPHPRISLEFNQAKDELYSELDRLSETVLRPMTGNGGGGIKDPPKNNASSSAGDPSSANLIMLFKNKKTKNRFVTFDFHDAVVGYDKKHHHPVIAFQVEVHDAQDKSRPVSKKWMRVELDQNKREGDLTAQAVEEALSKKIEKSEPSEKAKSEPTAEKSEKDTASGDAKLLEVSDDTSARICGTKEDAVHDIVSK